MENFNTILNILLGSGIISLLIFYKSKKRKSNAEASVSEFTALQMQITHLGVQLQEAYTMQDTMQDIIDKLRENLVEISKKYSELRLEFIKEQEKYAAANFNRCDISNCANRQPPRQEEK